MRCSWSASLFQLFGVICLAAADWSQDDFSLFDLVEELNVNFYTLFDITQDATLPEIKKAYRKLSLQWHPDKNDDPLAAEKFRQIAAVYDVLKNAESRQKYNDVLEFGLPDWRQPIYYFRKVRKMPWWESLVLLGLIVCTGHYLMLWGAYWERRLTLQDSIESKLRRNEKKLRRKFNVSVDELLERELSEHVERPRLRDTLPCAVARLVRRCVCAVPDAARRVAEWSRRPPPVEHADGDDDAPGWERPSRPYEPTLVPEMATDLLPVAPTTVATEGAADESAESAASGGEWTVAAVAQLIRLSTEKYPLGTQARWAKLAAAVGRSEHDVTEMIGRLKRMDPYERLRGLQSVTGDSALERRPAAAEAATSGWSQVQQSCLEAALKQHPKGTSARWEKVAECVPDKSKEDCMQRYSELVAMVRRRQEQAGRV